MGIGRRHRWWLIALAAFLVVGALDASGHLNALENAGMDLRARSLMREVPSDIVIVGIDGEPARDRQWPWPRRHHAKLVEELITGRLPTASSSTSISVRSRMRSTMP